MNYADFSQVTGIKYVIFVFSDFVFDLWKLILCVYFSDNESVVNRLDLHLFSHGVPFPR